jgi:transposase-like protein
MLKMVVLPRPGSGLTFVLGKNAEASGVYSLPAAPRRLRIPGFPLRCMFIIVHLGTSIKACRDGLRSWAPARCPRCGGDRVRPHDTYLHEAEPGQRPLEIPRFRCGRCGARFSVLPDALLPRCSYPALVRDRAVQRYVRGEAPYEAIAAEMGVSKSTVWRWVHAATESGARWLTQTQAGLRALGEADGPVVFRHDLRALFLQRRVRRPGMLEGLVVVEALLGWMDRLRAALERRHLGPVPAGLFAFGRQVAWAAGVGMASGP